MRQSLDIRNILNDHFPGLAFLINFEGNVILFNSEVRRKVPRIHEGIRVFDIFESRTAEILEKLFIESKEFGKIVKDEVALNIGKVDKVFQIVVSLTEDENYLLTITETPDRQILKQTSRFTVNTNKIEEIVTEPKILEIIEQVKASYPFTFIGKNNLQRTVDELDGLFWIKDGRGNYSIVNKKFALSLGLKSTQIEGRKESEFLPKYVSELNEKLNAFIRDTSNTLVMEGVYNLIPLDSNKKSEIIEFPICDIDNNVVAIIGFSQAAAKDKKIKTKNERFYENSVISLNEAILLIDESGKIVTTNDEFNKLFDIEDAALIYEKPYFEFFDQKISDEITSLVTSDKLIYDFKYEFNDQNISFSLKKILDEKETALGYGVYCRKEIRQDSQTNDKVKMYDLILETSPEAMFIYDVENLKFLEVNSAALKMYGYSKTAFLQMDLTDLYAPEDIQTLLQSSQSTGNEKTFTGPWRHKRKDGSSVLVEISKSTVTFKERKAHINIIRDVGKKIENEKQLQIFKASFENTGDLIVHTDKDGFITSVNESVSKVLGYSKMELSEKSFLSLIADKERGRINSSIFQAEIKEPVNIKLELKKSGNDNIEGELVATPILDYDKEIDSFILLIKTEKTTEKIVEVEVEKEVAVSETKSSENVKGLDAEFLSNVFHEILTPINVIIGFGQELSESISNPDPDQIEATEIIKENQKMLMQIMDTVSEYTMLEADKAVINKEEIAFVDVVDDVIENCKKNASARNVEISYGKISSSLKFETDKQRFSSLISEFLKFSIQFTKEKKVYLSAYLYDNKHFVISVKDNRGAVTPDLVKSLSDLLSSDEHNLRRNYGISRFTSRLFGKLVNVLGASGEEVIKAGDTVEYGLVFPLEFVGFEGEEDTKQEIEEEKFSEPVVNEPITSNFEPEPISFEEPNEKFGREIENAIFEENPQTDSEKSDTTNINTNQEQAQNQNMSFNVNIQAPETPQFQQQVPPAAAESQPAPAEIPPVEKIEEKQEPENEDEFNLSKYTCIYLEDQIDSQLLFKVQVKELKSIDFAISLERALPLIKAKQYDFIVMDMNLQGEYNGLDALRIVRKLPGYEHVPIIAATAYVLPGDKEKFIAAGFTDFITKPIMRNKLIDCLKNIYSHSS